MELKPEDLRVSTYRIGGTQWTVKVDSGVKVLHIPTGISVSVSVHSEHSQHRNKAIAFERLEKLVARAKVKPNPKPVYVQVFGRVDRFESSRWAIEVDNIGRPYLVEK